MTEPIATERGNGEGPPDPRDRHAFEQWLEEQPRDWSMVIAARAALRVLPLAGSDANLPVVILSMFRDTATARFASKYRKYAIDGARAVPDTRIVYAYSDPASAADCAAAFAARAARDYSAVVASAADAVAAAIYAVSEAGVPSHPIADALRIDAQQLYDWNLISEQLAAAPLWPTLSPPQIGGAWQGLAAELNALGRHWSVWIDWYNDLLSGAPLAVTTEAEDAAFTDVPGELPWDDGAEAVNTEIARRLGALRRHYFEPPTLVVGRDAESRKTETIARLAEVASPQPSINDKGQLDAGPNKPFDIPTVDEDLSTLPLRQRNLIKGILSDLPTNAPKHLKRFLRSYEDELQARGTQPIIGLLKDDAEIIAAAVSAPSADDEWLEPGMRKAFDRFADNHALFVDHFPLDAEREAIYGRTPLHENLATGKQFSEPFEKVAIAAKEAHEAGIVTGDFLAATEAMSDTARVLSTLPPAPNPDIKLSTDDRIVPVSTKQRAILGGLGFFNGADQRLANTANAVTIAAGLAPPLQTALQLAVDALSRWLR